MKQILFIILSLNLSFSCLSTPVKNVITSYTTDSLQSSFKSAGQIVMHYWDNFNFNDTVVFTDTNFLEQYFADYLKIMSEVDYDTVCEAISKFVDSTSLKAGYRIFFSETIDKYLYEPDSPLYNEELYIIFLQNILESSNYPDIEKLRFRHNMNEAMKNRVGTSATDFGFITSDGQLTSLLSSPESNHSLLIFFDPDCEHCRETIEELVNIPEINNLIRNHRLNIIAVYSGEDKELWQIYASSLPDNWIVGFEPGQIYEKDLYALPTFPTIYLLDSEKRIIAKNVSLPQLLRLLSIGS